MAATWRTVVDRPLLAGDLVALVAARYAALLNTWDGEATPNLRRNCASCAAWPMTSRCCKGPCNEPAIKKTSSSKQLEEDRKRDMAEAKDKALAPIWAMFGAEQPGKVSLGTVFG